MWVGESEVGDEAIEGGSWRDKLEWAKLEAWGLGGKERRIPWGGLGA